ncbi:MAG TPA: metal-dependent hydrolase [Candidatus Acidoferrum sp.]|jgi:membrane-bound metal-dependent hydrolase YbcI (DUF457 family)
MDTITHGIAGALIAKGLFHGQDMFAPQPMNRRRIVTWSLMLGAIFPDSDTFRDIFSRDPMLILTWHRSITHSLLFLPVFALALAALTRAFVRWKKWDAPSFAALVGIYAVGILSHILLDLVTSFGTMIWSPLNWSRSAWDLVFIVDFTLAALLLLPQILAWVYARREKLQIRALGCWIACGLAAFAVAALAKAVGAPISFATICGAIVILAALFLLPALREFGLRIRYSTWNRAGIVATLIYLALVGYAHSAALARVKSFATLMNLDVQSIAALPLPPSLWHWDGLVSTPRGVYEIRMDMSDPVLKSTLNSSAAVSLEYRYYPQANSNSYIATAKLLPQVQTVLWFDRFPVIRFHKEGASAVVEIIDVRFSQIRPDRPAPFTYQVGFNPAGEVISQGWQK